MAKIKAAFIGCGGRNGVHLDKCMDMGDVEFVGFCDVVEEKAYSYAARTKTDPEGKIFRNYKIFSQTQIPKLSSSQFLRISTAKSSPL